jgi:hypothetical protein
MDDWINGLMVCKPVRAAAGINPLIQKSNNPAIR